MRFLVNLIKFILRACAVLCYIYPLYYLLMNGYTGMNFFIIYSVTWLGGIIMIMFSQAIEIDEDKNKGDKK